MKFQSKLNKKLSTVEDAIADTPNNISTTSTVKSMVPHEQVIKIDGEKEREKLSMH